MPRLRLGHRASAATALIGTEFAKHKSMTIEAIYTPTDLHSKYGPAVLLGALVGQFEQVRALRLAVAVYDRFPALFPDFAESLVDNPASPKGACWFLAQGLSEVSGSYDLHSEALSIARS